MEWAKVGGWVGLSDWIKTKHKCKIKYKIQIQNAKCKMQNAKYEIQNTKYKMQNGSRAKWGVELDSQIVKRFIEFPSTWPRHAHNLKNQEAHTTLNNHHQGLRDLTQSWNPLTFCLVKIKMLMIIVVTIKKMLMMMMKAMMPMMMMMVMNEEQWPPGGWQPL